MNIINIKGNLNDKRVLTVISDSCYMPTEEKLNRLVCKYENDTGIFAFACEDNGLIFGVIILKQIDSSNSKS